MCICNNNPIDFNFQQFWQISIIFSFSFVRPLVNYFVPNMSHWYNSAKCVHIYIIEYIWNMDMKLCMGTWLYFKLRTSPLTLSMWLYKNICHIQVLVNKSFPTPPIKLKLGLLISARLLIATHWTNQTMLPIRNMEQSINMIQLYLVDFSKVPLRL
jgi:hypothetical protein